ncbi:unnamed protein product [Lactuca saligna]|uniref:Uncharacterized protein n=1 Tax=Lactuca saligna TaxID=75948 RepID=A0AA36E8R3_LACSI|nr:unnamed protein product [Lactuca saligna]
MSSAHTKDQSFGVIEVFLGLQVHGMLSQMDPALVSYCEKIAENRGPLTLPEEIGGSVHVAQMETKTMTRASSRLRNVQQEVNVDQSYEVTAEMGAHSLSLFTKIEQQHN